MYLDIVLQPLITVFFAAEGGERFPAGAIVTFQDKIVLVVSKVRDQIQIINLHLDILQFSQAFSRSAYRHPRVFNLQVPDHQWTRQQGVIHIIDGVFVVAQVFFCFFLVSVEFLHLYFLLNF